MFTGIVEEIGRVQKIEIKGENRRITIAAEKTPKQLKTGDSVACSGVCLTALNLTSTSFSADLAPETWVRTSLSRITEGALINLELPLRFDARMGGHIVQGHVDGVGKLIEFERIPNSDDYWLHIEVTPELEKYLVYKGSIAIEGISLTVAKLEGLRCTIAIIPHTVEMTNLKSLQPGDPVNIETDIVAKYLEKWMRKDEPKKDELTVAALTAKGF
jgi:riboflavin synthase